MCFPKGSPIWDPEKASFPNQSVLISTLGADILCHAVEVMERKEGKPWT